MKIDLLTQAKDSENAVLVVFSHFNKKDKQETVKILPAQFQKFFQNSIEGKYITGKSQELASFRDRPVENFAHQIVLGLGSNWSSEELRQSAALAFGQIRSMKLSHAMIMLDGASPSKSEAAAFIQAFAEGLLLASYEFDELKSTKKEKTSKSKLNLSLISKFAGEPSAKQALHAAHILAESVNFSRRLGDMPGNLMTPAQLAKASLEAIKGTKIKAQVWDRARLKKERMGGLLGVAAGSHQEPRFIILEYKGAAASKKPVVFVGKGLTFDTGGISIKPSANMEEMKYDMCGGANVLAALIAIAKLKLKVNAYALVPATENMPGGNATKPGDIHTARNGKTFEVNNTDAEGRLILADALSYGSELKPQVMIDAATLTGAMIIALGNIHTGFFTRNEEVANEVRKAAKKTGELVWQMPLTDFHVKDMKGTFADLSNISSGKGAGSATAAAFLEQFVDEGIPWVHFDIAGTGWATGNRLAYNTKKGATGVMVRTFVEIAKQYE